MADRKATGAELIAAERLRQITEEGHAPAADLAYNCDQLAQAAGAYLTHGTGIGHIAWPWPGSTWRPAPRSPHDGYWTAENVAARTRDLAKAGALIAAEIDRLTTLALDRTGQSR